MTIEGVLENILSDILFILIAVLLGWLFLFITKRRNLQRFFSTRITKRLVIYLSNIQVLPFGAVGIDGQIMSYQGSAVAYGEMESANRIRDIFSLVVPSLADDPGFLRRILLSDVKVQISISPSDFNDLESEASIISLGSAAYNVASSYIEEKLNFIAGFRYGIITRDDSQSYTAAQQPTAYSTDSESVFIPGIPLPSGIDLGTRRPEDEESTSAILVEGIPPIEDPTYGFVERIFEEDIGRFVFFVAGLSEYATVGAANYLISQWRQLDRKYKRSEPFMVLLNFDEDDLRKWTVVLERSNS